MSISFVHNHALILFNRNDFTGCVEYIDRSKFLYSTKRPSIVCLRLLLLFWDACLKIHVKLYPGLLDLLQINEQDDIANRTIVAILYIYNQSRIDNDEQPEIASMKQSTMKYDLFASTKYTASNSVAADIIPKLNLSNTARYYTTVGIYFSTVGKHAIAHAMFEKAAEAENSDPTLFNQGYAKMILGEYELAKVCFEKCHDDRMMKLCDEREADLVWKQSFRQAK